MSNLPKIQNYPTKKITLPISKKKVTIRPFVVKEEKILIMIRENENSTAKDYINGMCDIAKSCVEENLDPYELNEVDISYLFLQIRMMSKGEASEVSYMCKAQDGDEECGQTLNIKIDLNAVEAYIQEGYKDLFEIPGNDIHIKMRMPTIRDAIVFEENGIQVSDMKNLKWSELDFIITSCVESIIEGDAEDSNVCADYSREELSEWFETVPDTVLEDIVDNFLSSMPYLKYKVNHKCPKCGTEHEFDIVGVDNFFG